jgi:hypothetical protein
LKIIDKQLASNTSPDSVAFLNNLKQKTFIRLDSLRKDSTALFALFVKEVGGEKQAQNQLTGMYFGRSMLHDDEKDILNLDTIVKDLNKPYKFKSDIESEKYIGSDQFKMLHDSTKISFRKKNGLKVADADILNLPLDDFYKKYNIENFWDKIWAKIIINYNTKGKDIVHSFFSKSIYISIVGLIPNAFFLLFLYRRQHRLLVEHLVFLLHFHCFQSLCSVVNLLPFFNAYSNLVQLSLGFFALFFALKMYYQQSWGKTIIKGLILNFFILMIPATLIFIGLALSFALF